MHQQRNGLDEVPPSVPKLFQKKYFWKIRFSKIEKIIHGHKEADGILSGIPKSYFSTPKSCFGLEGGRTQLFGLAQPLINEKSTKTWNPDFHSKHFLQWISTECS